MVKANVSAFQLQFDIGYIQTYTRLTYKTQLIAGATDLHCINQKILVARTKTSFPFQV